MANSFKVKKIKTSAGRTLYKIVKGKSEQLVEVGNVLYYTSKIKAFLATRKLNKYS